VAGIPDQKIDHTTVLTAASKYPNVAEHYYEQKGITVDTIKLNGSDELAPLIGMADAIVDIVETGNTINETGPTIIEDLEPISTRLIINKSSITTKTREIQQIIKKLESVLE